MMNAYWNNYFFHSFTTAAAETPIWLLVLLGAMVVGFIGFMAWVIKETWIF